MRMTPMQIFLVALWLLTFTDGVAALLASRQAMRLRGITKNRVAFEWLTAFGVGLAFYGIEVLGSVLNAIVAGPPADVYTGWFLGPAFALRLLRTLGMWLIALTLMNGGTPGSLRRIVFWVLDKVHVVSMDVLEKKLSPVAPQADPITQLQATPALEPVKKAVEKANALPDSVEAKVDSLIHTAKTVDAALKKSQGRADDNQGLPGEAADAAAGSGQAKTDDF